MYFAGYIYRKNDSIKQNLAKFYFFFSKLIGSIGIIYNKNFIVYIYMMYKFDYNAKGAVLFLMFLWQNLRILKPRSAISLSTMKLSNKMHCSVCKFSSTRLLSYLLICQALKFCVIINNKKYIKYIIMYFNIT